MGALRVWPVAAMEILLGLISLNLQIKIETLHTIRLTQNTFRHVAQFLVRLHLSPVVLGSNPDMFYLKA